jgi:SPP1 gp7 family putative phage head morphogenesis protein
MAKKKDEPTINTDELAYGIHTGDITPLKLPENVYFYNADKLKEAAEKGLKVKFSEITYGAPNYGKIEAIRQNIYMFSAAKTFQQVVAMNDALTKDGNLVSFSDFKDAVEKISGQYNGMQVGDYLKTEYVTAEGQAASAANWWRFEAQKEALPYLQYQTQEDEGVCEICEPCDGVTLPVDDPFWDENTPLQHFWCGCILIQLEEQDAEQTTQDEVDSIKEKVDPEKHGMFMTNPGKSGELFNKNAPYFDVPVEYKELARENFNMKIPDHG